MDKSISGINIYIQSLRNVGIRVRKLLETQAKIKLGVILGLAIVYSLFSIIIIKYPPRSLIKKEGYVELLNATENVYYNAELDNIEYIWYRFSGNNERWSFKNPVYIILKETNKRIVPDFISGRKIKIPGCTPHEIVVNKQHGTVIQRGIIYK